MVTGWWQASRRGWIGVGLAAVIGTACTQSTASTPAATPPITVATPTAMTSPNGTPAFGAVVYIPAYSHIYYHDRARVINLTITLSVRNTDTTQPIQIDAVRYYGDTGVLAYSYVAEPLTLGPLAATDFVVEEAEATGGVGASFLVTWHSAAPVTAPVVEAVMISADSTQGISFVSVGRVVESFSGATAPTD